MRSIYVSKEKPIKPLKINQANVFYNYSIGFDCLYIDLLKTGAKLLEAGVSKSIFFSDFKCMYLDSSGKRQVEIISPEGRQWDSSWKIKLSDKIPKNIASDLFNSLEIAFHENQFQNHSVPYMRASLPPLVIDFEGYHIPLYSSVKIFSNGLAVLSFQMDQTWEGLDEGEFISQVVNIFKCYFKSIWVDSKLQKLDANIVLINAYQDYFSLGGEPLKSFRIRRLIKKMKNESRHFLEETLKRDGELFVLDGFDWALHKIVGTENTDSKESTIEQCRSIYCNSISSLLVTNESVGSKSPLGYFWQGRPSISLMRFEEQPSTKGELLNSFANSINRILMRAENVVSPLDLPIDLRLFNDSSLHLNRATILWTWLKTKDCLDDAWNESNTMSRIYENQARTEHLEYNNINIARACSWAQSPINSDYLLTAYEVLANSEVLVHQSSNAGEVNDALSHAIQVFGTASLVNPSKEAARFHLDELRYKSDQAKSRSDRWLAVTFGLVGAASLADFVFHPLVQKVWPSLSNVQSPLISIGISIGIIIFVALIILLTTNRKNS